MAIATPARATRAFVLLNPVAGTCTADDVRRALERHFVGGATSCEIHETSRDDCPEELAREARGRGFDMVIAAGGDGTVSAVANGLVGSATPLGIIPLGTANVLARELGIPVDLEGACQLLAGAHGLKSVDAMRVGDQNYFTQVGVGIDALMIRDTGREAKRRFGRIAYIWTALTRLLGFQPRKFLLAVDGRKRHFRASQVLVANGGILGQPPFRWGPGIRPDDGRLDVCIVRARTLLDYLRLAWHVLTGQHKKSPNVKYLASHRDILIDTKHPLPVQADGEIIGETPVRVVAAPGAIQVVVPVTISRPFSGLPLVGSPSR
jgi:diacylglycerol kinase (ATP)